MGQTGDDYYERLGLPTRILLAALLLLIAQLRKVMEENALLAVSGADVIRKSKDHDSRKKKMRSKCTVSGLEFIDLDATISGKPQARRCGKNKGYRKGNR